MSLRTSFSATPITFAFTLFRLLSTLPTAFRLVWPARVITTTPSTTAAIWRGSAKPSSGGGLAMRRSYSGLASANIFSKVAPRRSAALRERRPMWENEGGMTLQQLRATRRDSVLGLAARHGAHNVRVFGSVARGESDPQSDVDFLVDLDPGRTLSDRKSVVEGKSGDV